MGERWRGRIGPCLLLTGLWLSGVGLRASADEAPPLPTVPRGHRGDAAAAARFRATLGSWLGAEIRDRPRVGGSEGDEALRGLRLHPAPDAPFDRVVLVSIDGLRPDALGPDSPVLARMVREGAYAAVAETIHRSTTLPSHASMLTGVRASVHGITWNGRRPRRGKVRFPTVLRVARAAGLPTAFFVGKRKLEHLVHGDDTDAFEVAGSRCRLVNRRADPYLRTMSSGLAVLHYPDPDGAGHAHGWMSASYAAAVSRADACIGELLGMLRAAGPMDRTLVLVTADHGGHDHTHGSARAADVRIPWIAWGPSIAPASVSEAVHTTDTAATVLTSLGLPLPRGSEGHPIALPRRDPRFAPPLEGPR